MRNYYILTLLNFYIFLLPATGLAQDFIRLKGYYRTYQYTDSVLTHVVDGMMEFYIPTDGRGEFADRKFLGERLQTDGSDETFLRMALPNLEVTPLIRSIDGEEYSQRNNGDVYLMDKLAGRITRSADEVTIEMDELTGRPNHELDLSQLKLVGLDARMTTFAEKEVYYNANENANENVNENVNVNENANENLVLRYAGKHQVFAYRLRGEDDWHKADVVSDFYVTDHAVISKKEKRQLMRQKNKIRQFVVPDFVPDIP